MGRKAEFSKYIEKVNNKTYTRMHTLLITMKIKLQIS